MTVPAGRVLGWRYWQLDTAGACLRSVSQRRFEWPPGRPLRTVCVGGGHGAPADGCNRGIYGARDFARLRPRGLCLAPDILVGEVALWGRVLTDEGFHRGEYAYPHTLAVVEDTVSEGRLEDMVAILGDYGVPTSTASLNEAVGEVSAAQMAFQAMARRTFP